MSRNVGPKTRPQTEAEFKKYYKNCQRMLLIALTSVTNCLDAVEAGNEPNYVDLSKFLDATRAAEYEVQRLC